MPKPNTEQLEAKEIDSLPRIVITAKDVIMFPRKDSEIALGQAELLAAIMLMKALEKASG